VPARPPPPPTLAQVFATAGDTTSADTAFGGLFQLWNARYLAGPTDPCTQAETHGLYCVTLHSSLAQLREIGRPALLMLGEGGVPSHQVVLTGIGPDRVELQVGARTVRAAIADLSLYWFGDCVLLWHPTTPPVPELRPGMHGPAVRSLRVQLLQANGATPQGVQSATFDAELTRLVEEFQRAHHLTVDGIAGIETQLILDSLLAAPGTPILRTLAASTTATAG
jgi:general secretion pathway protein A